MFKKRGLKGCRSPKLQHDRKTVAFGAAIRSDIVCQNF